jgi:hypothetical protein
MNDQDLLELLNRAPFSPFRLRLSNGEVHEVRNPDTVVVMKTKVFIAFDDDRFVLIPLRHVASVEGVQAA